jgi:CelD/BcsL family acetyltransferase involved in cellulose biosynthesis
VVLALRDAGWELGQVPFKFQFGDIVIGRAVLPLVRRNARLDEPPLCLGKLPEPPPRLDGADGYVVWSHPISTKLPVLRTRNDAVLYMPRQYERFSIELSGDFDRYMAHFSGKTRSSLRRKVRKFADASGGAIDFREYRTPDQIADFLPLARKVSAKSYQERLLGIGLPADQVFLASALQSAAGDGVRAYLLFLAGEPVSYLYCPVEEGTVQYDRLGYDPEWSSLSPGTVLQLLALQTLFSEKRFTNFDFTEGEGQHKELFSTQSCLCADVYVLSRRLKPVLLTRLHHAADSLSAAAGTLLDQLNLRSRLRRLARSMR